MSRRSTILLPSSHDGTSQRSRALAALDPGYATIDERSSADLFAFVQALVEKLRYWTADEVEDQLREAGSWQAFASNPDLSVADIVAYAREPERFTGEQARWLSRPHFALLLTFIELLGRARLLRQRLLRPLSAVLEHRRLRSHAGRRSRLRRYRVSCID